MGQLADTILVLDSVKDAIVISNNLIKKVDGTKVVYVLKNGEKTAVEVETGLSTGSQTEIKSVLKRATKLLSDRFERISLCSPYCSVKCETPNGWCFAC